MKGARQALPQVHSLPFRLSGARRRQAEVKFTEWGGEQATEEARACDPLPQRSDACGRRVCWQGRCNFFNLQARHPHRKVLKRTLQSSFTNREPAPDCNRLLKFRSEAGPATGSGRDSPAPGRSSGTGGTVRAGETATGQPPGKNMQGSGGTGRARTARAESGSSGGDIPPPRGSAAGGIPLPPGRY